MYANINPWMNPKHLQEDRDMNDREFWKQHNRRKHQHWQSHKEQQRERFQEEANRPEPKAKPLTRVLPIVR